MLRQNEVRIKYDDQAALKLIEDSIIDLLPIGNQRNIVVVCIGTDRSTGDSLGPMIGTFLQEHGLKNFHLYGTLDDPVHAVNLSDKLSFIQENHYQPFVIAIDACLGKSDHIGTVKVAQGPVKPGAGVNKVLPEVGNMHITGIVNISGYMEFFVLQNTRLNLVMKMAKQIALSIARADQRYLNDKKFFIQSEWDNDENLSVNK